MRRIATGLAIGSLLWSVAVDAQAPESVPPAGAKAATVQQLFDDASAAMAAASYAQAVDLYTGLEARTSRNARSLAIVRVRKAMALVELSRWDEARLLLQQAAPSLPQDDPTLAGDRFDAAVTLARSAAGDLDYEGALRSYQAALPDAKSAADRLRVLTGMVLVGTFVDPEQALTWADDVQALVVSAKIGDKKILASIDNLRGSLLLNLGRFAEAEDLFKSAVKGQGGLSLRVDHADLIARSDAAIAAMLAGHREKAREYLIYTGAGRMPTQDFTSGADMALPPCGMDDVRPDDVAVVEFGIGDTGAVSYARPVYGSRRGPLALTFARAVTQWAWRPEDVKTIPPLFRLVTRLELRCSTAGGGPSILSDARTQLSSWLTDKGAAPAPPPGGNAAAQRTALLAAAQRLRAEKGEGRVMLVPLYLGLLSSPLAARDDLDTYGPALKQWMATSDAPLLARLSTDITVYDAAARLKGKVAPTSAFDIDPAVYAGDPEARATLAIVRYDRRRPSEKSRTQGDLDRIIADPALPADAPIKVAALVRRATARATANNLEGARQDFASTGMTAQQCSIVDARPSLKSAPTSYADYPTDLVHIGIEGWTKLEFDVAADGSTRDPRAVITYPPMTFGPNAVKIIARARYEQSYRPDGALGCGGNTASISFVK